MSSHTNHDVISLSDWSDTKLDKRDHIIAVKEANDLEVVEVIEVGEVAMFRQPTTQ